MVLSVTFSMVPQHFTLGLSATHWVKSEIQAGAGCGDGPGFGAGAGALLQAPAKATKPDTSNNFI